MNAKLAGRSSVGARLWSSQPWRLALVVFLVCKLAAPLIVFLGEALLGELAPGADVPAPDKLSLFDMWFRWDSQHYEKLATDANFFTPLTAAEHDLITRAAAGDHFAVPSSLHRFTFGPLYPALAKGLSVLLGGKVGLAMLLISNLAFFACLLLIYQLAQAVLPAGPALAEVPDGARHAIEPAAARHAVEPDGARYATPTAHGPRHAMILLALAPTAFLLQAGLTESLFLALTLGAFLTAERRRWGWVVVLAAAAALTRSSGFVIALPLLLIVLQQNRYRFDRGRLRHYLVALPGVAAAPIAWAGFMAYCWTMTGDLFAYTHLQSAGWWVTLHSPLSWLPSLVGAPNPALLKAWLVLAAAALVGYACVRLPMAYKVTAVMLLALPLMIGLWDQSILRYFVVIFPVALAGALLVPRRRWTRWLIFGALAVLQALLLLAWQLPWTYLIV